MAKTVTTYNALKKRTRRPGRHAKNLKRILAKYIGWGLLYMGKPFTAVGNWFWKRHRDVLDWGNK